MATKAELQQSLNAATARCAALTKENGDLKLQITLLTRAPVAHKMSLKDAFLTLRGQYPYRMTFTSSELQALMH
jgi:hypothetical protein